MSPARSSGRQVEFGSDDVAEVVAAMSAIAARGRGWVNLLPVVDPEIDVPPTPGALAVFNSRGPAVPLGTWTPVPLGGRETDRESVGIMHGSGVKAINRLAEAGLELPAGWQRISDHPRRGLVLKVAEGPDHTAVLNWTMEAMLRLTQVPLTGRWLAGVYDG